MEKPKFEPIQDCRSATYNRALDHWVSKGACFICVVTPSENGDIYAAVKKKLCIETPIPSQVITVSKVLSKVGLLKQNQKSRKLVKKMAVWRLILNLVYFSNLTSTARLPRRWLSRWVNFDIFFQKIQKIIWPYQWSNYIHKVIFICNFFFKQV